MASAIPQSQTNTVLNSLTSHKHPVFRQAAAQSYRFEVAAGNNASPTTKIIGSFDGFDAGLYSVLLETGNNTTFGFFRLDDGGTVTILQDAGAVLAATATNAKVAIFNNSGVLTINNQIGAGSTAAAVNVVIARLTVD